MAKVTIERPECISCESCWTVCPEIFEQDPADGLSDAEASGRLSEHGPNELKETGIKSPVLILWEQFTAVMVLILIAAAVVSGFIGKTVEMVAILAIVVMFAMLGFVQEYRAERAIASLKKLAVPLVRVRRNGVLREMSARELVPGDVLSLEAGNTVPADIRLVDAVNLRIQESALTGESAPAEQLTDAIPAADPPPGAPEDMGDYPERLDAAELSLSAYESMVVDLDPGLALPPRQPLAVSAPAALDDPERDQ